MSVDFDELSDRSPPRVTSYVPHPSDLEAIVTMLELAALYLTPKPGVEFTFDQLLEQAQTIGGGEIVLDERDVRIVVGNASFLKKRGRWLSLK